MFPISIYKYMLMPLTFLRVGKMMGEIKVALKKEMKTEGEQLVLEVLQCRNITYKFKSPDHLPGNASNLPNFSSCHSDNNK